MASLRRSMLAAGRRMGAAFGLDIHRRVEGHHYVPDIYGRSALKHADIRKLEPFGSLARSAVESGRCTLYYDRLFTVYQALENVLRLPTSRDGIGVAEVGVYRGGTGSFIASLLREKKLTFSLHAFDTFEGHAAEDLVAGTDTHFAGQFGDTSFEQVCAYLSVFPEVEVHQGRFQDECNAIAGDRFHFVHLDVDIYEPTRFALEFFDERLVEGGIVVMDDFYFDTCPGIERAYREFIDSHPEYHSFHLLSGQSVLIKR